MTPRRWSIAVSAITITACVAIWSGVLATMAPAERSTVCTVPNPPAATPGVPVVGR